MVVAIINVVRTENSIRSKKLFYLSFFGAVFSDGGDDFSWRNGCTV
jgi:hypothetical protein